MTAPTMPFPCMLLGEPTGQQIECPACVGRAKLKVFSCRKHGHCTPGKDTRQIHFCGTCPDRVPPVANGQPVKLGPTALEIVPGVRDPIIEPTQEPRPADWHRRLATRQDHMRALQHLASVELHPPKDRSGTGVVTLGGGKYWPMIAVQLRMLRRVSDLPVQVWYRGGEEPVSVRDVVDLGGVTLHDLTALRPAPRMLTGWSSKTTAIIASKLRKVLFLDADAYCVTNPRKLFDALSRFPLLYWSDMAHADGTIKWLAWGLDARSRPPTVQGGQIVLDTVGAWRQLVLAHWLNMHADYSYRHQFGDQDSWRLANCVLGIKEGCIGAAIWNKVAFVLQHEDAVIVHRCRAKLWGQSEDKFEPSLPGEPNLIEERSRVLHGHEQARQTVPTRIARNRGPSSEVPVTTQRDAPGSPVGVGDAALPMANAMRAKLWGPHHLCGQGSTPEQVKPYLEIIQSLAAKYRWRSFLDAGCGDGSVAEQLPPGKVYGLDCVLACVSACGSREREIEVVLGDVAQPTDQWPVADVLLCKDVLHHLPNADVERFLRYFLEFGVWKYLCLTYDFRQFKYGKDCDPAGYRPLQYEYPPLDIVKPCEVLHYLHKEVIVVKNPREVRRMRDHRKRRQAGVYQTLRPDGPATRAVLTGQVPDESDPSPKD